MTTKAISLLKDSDRGFFLQVEGVSIDKKAHAANACGQIGEAVDLDEAVEAAMKFAKADGNRSVFVTADHAHTSQIVEAGVTPGITVNLLTADDAPMTISCATAAAGGSQQHTTAPSCGSRAYGPQAANIVGLTDQTELFFTISRALRLG